MKGSAVLTLSLDEIQIIQEQKPAPEFGELFFKSDFTLQSGILPPEQSGDVIWVSGNNEPQGRTEIVEDEGEKVFELSLDNDIEQAGARAFAGKRWNLFVPILNRVAIATWKTKIMQPINIPEYSWMSLGIQGKGDPNSQATWATNVEKDLRPWLQASGVHLSEPSEPLPVGSWFDSSLLIYARDNPTGYLRYVTGNNVMEAHDVKTIGENGGLGFAFVLYCGFITHERLKVRFKDLKVRLI